MNEICPVQEMADSPEKNAVAAQRAFADIGLRIPGWDLHPLVRRNPLCVCECEEIEGLPGQDGGDAAITGPPFTLVPGFPAVVAKSKQVLVNDRRFWLGGSRDSALFRLA